MDIQHIERRFAKIGARAKIGVGRRNNLSIDIRRDGKGEYFDVTLGRGAAAELDVLDIQPKDRHLLMMSRDDAGKHKFLCGHDERHWFVAAVPEASSASTVLTAKEALKPREVQLVQRRLKLKARARNRRRNGAFVRQGEWFFVPFEGQLGWTLLLRNEPLRRGRGKPHVVEELVRDGGELVYVNYRFPNGLTERQYRQWVAKHPEQARDHWQTMRRNPTVYARGKVRHEDHKTIQLRGWHRVLLNTENLAAAMRNVAFLD